MSFMIYKRPVLGFEYFRHWWPCFAKFLPLAFQVGADLFAGVACGQPFAFGYPVFMYQPFLLAAVALFGFVFHD